MRYRLGERLALFGAVLWSIALIVGAFTVPMYDSDAVSSSASGSGSTATLVEVNGRSCLTYVAIPLVVTLVVAALLWHRRPARRSLLVCAWVCTALFGLVTTVGHRVLEPVVGLTPVVQRGGHAEMAEESAEVILIEAEERKPRPGESGRRSLAAEQGFDRPQYAPRVPDECDRRRDDLATRS